MGLLAPFVYVFSMSSRFTDFHWITTTVFLHLGGARRTYYFPARVTSLNNNSSRFHTPQLHAIVVCTLVFWSPVDPL